MQVMSESLNEPAILYETQGPLAIVTLNRPEVRNAQNAQLLLDLDKAYRRAEADDQVRVILLKANGKHFSAGHDMSPQEYERYEREVRRGRPGIVPQMDWERENYLELTWRWRNIPKPTIAVVQGKCIAGGLMLMWPCDLVVASEDAEFSDPVVRMGIGGVEYHAHAWEMGARKAKEMLFTGRYMGAAEAERIGMVNQVVPREELDAKAMELATRIAQMDPFGLRMAKASVNRTLDTMGQWTAMTAIFDLHHMAHAQSQILNAGNVVGGLDIAAMKKAGAA
jgi:enoyl-CoA hydratase/carnithine racemase